MSLCPTDEHECLTAPYNADFDPFNPDASLGGEEPEYWICRGCGAALGFGEDCYDIDDETWCEDCHFTRYHD